MTSFALLVALAHDMDDSKLMIALECVIISIMLLALEDEMVYVTGHSARTCPILKAKRTFSFAKTIVIEIADRIS